jgi:CheY-like chemotaxis protein
MSTQLKHVLLFDDDYESMLPLKEYLENTERYRVELTAAHSIMERLRLVRFDLICIDLSIHPNGLDGQNQPVDNVHYPGINWRVTGLEFLRRLRDGDVSTYAPAGTRADTPVIIISALARSSVSNEPILQQPDIQYIEKPFDVEEVVRLMENMLG